MIWQCFTQLLPISLQKLPFISACPVSHLGSSSYSNKCILQNGITGDILSEESTRLVRVGIETRKPFPFSKLWKEKYQNIVPNKKVIINDITDIPTAIPIYWHERFIVANHIDLNGHTNVF